MSMTKKAMMGLFASALAAMPLASFAEEAAESDLSASVDVPVLSAYTWRGQVLVDGRQSAIANPREAAEKIWQTIAH